MGHNVWLYDFVAFRNELYNVLPTVRQIMDELN